MGAEAFSAQSEHPWGMSDIWAPLRRSRLTTGLRIHISHPRNAFIKQPDPGTSPFSLYKGTDHLENTHCMPAGQRKGTGEDGSSCQCQQ